MKGGFSGGTIDSMRAQAEAVEAVGALRKVLADPYSLSPDRECEPDLGRQGDAVGIRRDPELGVWLGPFVMSPYSTRVVRLSNAIQGWAYGPRFRYQEYQAYGDGFTGSVSAAAASAGLAGAVVGMSLRPTRSVLDRFLPAPATAASGRPRAIRDTRRRRSCSARPRSASPWTATGSRTGTGCSRLRRRWATCSSIGCAPPGSPSQSSSPTPPEAGV